MIRSSQTPSWATSGSIKSLSAIKEHLLKFSSKNGQDLYYIPIYTYTILGRQLLDFHGSQRTDQKSVFSPRISRSLCRLLPITIGTPGTTLNHFSMVDIFKFFIYSYNVKKKVYNTKFLAESHTDFP